MSDRDELARLMYENADWPVSQSRKEFDRWLTEHDREVEARGLEKAAEEWERMVLREKPPVRGYLFLRARAQQVREGN